MHETVGGKGWDPTQSYDYKFFYFSLRLNIGSFHCDSKEEHDKSSDEE